MESSDAVAPLPEWNLQDLTLAQLEENAKIAVQFLTAMSPEWAEAGLAMERAPAIPDVWRKGPSSPGWIIVRSDGSGQYSREVPEGETIGPPIEFEDPTPLANFLGELLEERLSRGVQEPADWMVKSMPALEPGYFDTWWPSVLDRAADKGWQGVVEVAHDDHAVMAAHGIHVGVVTLIALIADEVQGPLAEGVAALLSSIRRPGWAKPNPPALIQAVVDYVGMRAGLEPIETACSRLLESGEETRNFALDAEHQGEFGWWLRIAAAQYLGVAFGARSGRELAEANGLDAKKISRLEIVADERQATIGPALTSWFGGPNGPTFERFRRVLSETLAKGGDEAVERELDQLIERLWLFPRAYRSRLLGAQ